MSNLFDGVLESIAETANKLVKNTLPAKQYKSTIGIYGGVIVDIEGKMVYKTGGLRNALDVGGDRVLRRFDDHVVQEPGKMLRERPRDFLRILLKSQPMRYRGTPEQIVQNIERLGLTGYYGPHEQGIEIKKPDIFKKGIALQDIYKADQIQAEVLKDINRFQALGVASGYIRDIHNRYGPIGEIVGHIMFQRKDGAKVKYPILTIPDIILTPSRAWMETMQKVLVLQAKRHKVLECRTSNLEDMQLDLSEMEAIYQRVSAQIAKEQKATDVLELIVSSGFEELRRSHDPALVKKAMTTIAENYNDPMILGVVKSFIKRGRPTLPGDTFGGFARVLFSLHNRYHLDADKERGHELREIIVNALHDYLNVGSSP